MKKISLLIVATIWFLGTKAQISYPNPYSLSLGNYFFNFWDPNAIAATYPNNMGFYRLGTQNDPLLADTIIQDYSDAYNLSSGTRMIGQNFGGFSFLNTGGGTPSPNRLGAAVLALNTTGRQNVQVSWTGRTVTPNFREYEIRLFYRIGSSSSWMPVLNSNNDTVRYVRNATAGDSLVLGPITLPASVNNQALVQLCWKYFQTYNNNGANQRAELSVNNVTVSSTAIPTVTPNISISPATLNPFTAFLNNTSITDSFNLSANNLIANVVINAPTYFEIANSLTGTYGSSLTFTPTSGLINNAKIYVRFHPTNYGTFSDSLSLTSTNAITKYVHVTGNTPTPGITTSFNGFTNPFGSYVTMYSAVDSFFVSGSALTSNITIDAPQYFEVSSTISGSYSSTLTLTQNNGIIPSTYVYVRFHPLLTGNFYDSIKLSSSGASTKYINVNGMTLAFSSLATNPVPFQLASTSYVMNQWDSMSSAGTYPANMIFHTTNTATPDLTFLPLSYDWHCAYNLTARPRVRGLGSDGFSMINTGSPQYDDCISGGPVTQNMFTGAAILALNTVNANLITLKYDAGLVKQSDGTTPRVYNVRLQYRFDTLAVFQDYTPINEYSSSGKNSGDLQHFQFVLPAVFENKPYVQLRWLYYNDNSISGAGGTRPEIRIDNINVSTPNSVNSIDIQNYQLTSYPNPVGNGELLHFSQPISGFVIDVFGKKLAQIINSNQLNIVDFPQGVYSILLDNNCNIKFIVK